MAPPRRWVLAPPPPDALSTGLPDAHPVVLRALASRGLVTPEAARSFLAREVGDDDPWRIAGMAEAVERLLAAARDGERVAVYGDYDADGVTATAVVVHALAAIGVQAQVHIPDRALDGYGVHARAVEDLARDGTRLLVTVDCGIRSAAEVELARSLGMDVIVTDHHLLAADLPAAVAVINPRRHDCDYGYRDLSGVGLAYKLAQALARAAGVPEPDVLDLVAIGTVADVVPLRGENRSLVDRGLRRMRRSPRPGVAALLAAAGRAAEALTARDLAFVVGPRLNAAGRMGRAQLALELLLSEGPGAAELAARLEALNRERRTATDDALHAAEASLVGCTDGPLLAFASPDVELGVAGLVAGRLCERHYRPAMVARVDGDVARGSARSVPEFDVTAALDSASHLLVRHGGHARAAGFTVRVPDLAALFEHVARMADAAFAGLSLQPALAVDGEIDLAAVDWALHEALEALEPLGEANPRPLLLVRDVALGACRQVGQGHLKFSCSRGPGVPAVDAIAFGAAHRQAELGGRADLVVALRANEWHGQRRLELEVEDLAPAGRAPIVDARSAETLAP